MGRGLYNEIRDWLDAAKVGFPLRVRGWRAGDSYPQAGHDGSVKLKDRFQRARVPSWKRNAWPIVEYEGRIAWTREFGPADWAAPGPASGRLIGIEEIPLESISDEEGRE